MTKLRLGILARAASFEPWEVRLFDTICNDGRFEFVAIMFDARDSSLSANNAPSLFGRAMALDKKILARDVPHAGPAFPKALATAIELPLRPDQTGVLSNAVAETVGGLALDVVLVHGLDDLAGPLSSLTRFGAWSLLAAGQRLCTTSPRLVLACLNASALVDVTLVATSQGGATRRAIASASFNIEKSPATTLSRTAEKGVSVVWRALHRLADTRRLEFDLPSLNITQAAPCSAVSNPLDTLRYGGALARIASGKIAKKLAHGAGRQHTRWSLMFGEGPFDVGKLAQSNEVLPGNGEFWADPFLIQKNAETFVFFENYVYATGLGKISVGIYRDGQLRVLGDALQRPYHLSFPFVFEHGGATYMMPETCAAKRLEVWRAVAFPLQWELFATALPGQSVADPVLVQDQDRWWLFANISTTPFEDHCNELYVFEVDGPGLKRIVPHRLNPVVIGSDTARNAGRIVRRAGKLLRLSQNNAHGIYGYGLNTMEITQLDARNYQEHRVATLTPDFKPGLIGCHHMDQCAGLFVVDACRRFG